MRNDSLKAVLIFFCLCMVGFSINAQDGIEDHSYKPLKLNLSEDGSKYIRFIMWHQIWLTSNNLSNPDQNLNANVSIRRSRFLAFSQVSPRFLILTHFGLNGLNADNLTTLGNNGDAAQFFLHGAWGEVMLNKNIYVGAGLHYWKGMTRLANQSTLNFMTLDQSRPFYAWHSLGITDQFARHLGIYLKGSSGKFEYRAAVNSPSKNTLGDGKDYSGAFYVDAGPQSDFTYTGMNTLDRSGNTRGQYIIEGYAKYNFFDGESTKLPYYVGTYLGKKKVLAVGGGFFYHPKGMYNENNQEHRDVLHFAIDGFLDVPFDLGAINAYGAIQHFDYGENYISRWAGTGNTIFGQFGVYFEPLKIMPYIAYSNANFEGASEAIQALDIGVNYFINGHHAKVTAEYHYIRKDYREAALTPGVLDDISQIRVQLHVFL